MPPTFQSDDNYELANEGDLREFPAIGASLDAGDIEITIKVVERDQAFKGQADFSPRERWMLNNCGLMAHIRQGRRPLSARKAVSAGVDQGSPITNVVQQEPPIK